MCTEYWFKSQSAFKAADCSLTSCPSSNLCRFKNWVTERSTIELFFMCNSLQSRLSFFPPPAPKAWFRGDNDLTRGVKVSTNTHSVSAPIRSPTSGLWSYRINGSAALSRAAYRMLSDLPSCPQSTIMTPSDGLLLFTLAPPTQFNRLVHWVQFVSAVKCTLNVGINLEQTDECTIL